jgi:hypothetical protein
MLGIVLMVATVSLLTSCHKDDDKNDNSNPEESDGKSDSYDDLDVFQKAICRLDSAGHLVRYHIGEVLYESDPQHLYIGVDNIEEASAYFRSWIAPDVELADITPTTNDLVAALTDTLGKPQGTIYFKAGTGTAVAEVTASGDTQLKYVDKITFLQNSAWPHNSAAKAWHLGDIRAFRLTGDCGGEVNSIDKTLNFVLVREKGNGVKPMWCAITNDSYGKSDVSFTEASRHKTIMKSDYCPDKAMAETIAKMLQTQWSFFTQKFDEAGSGKLSETTSYWINSTHTSFLAKYWDVMMYSNSWVHGIRKDEYSVQCPYLFKIDWLDDGQELPYNATASNKVHHTNQSSENIFDGDKETKWCVPAWAKESSEVSGKMCWFVEFECYRPITPYGYQMVTGDDTEDYPGRNPRIWTIYAKKKYRDKWTIIDSRDNTYNAVEQMTPENYWIGTWGIDGLTDTYSYFRLEVYENAGMDDEETSNFQISEFWFLCN